MIYGQAIERFLSNGEVLAGGGCDMMTAEQAIKLSRELTATCIEHDTSATGGGVTYYYQGREIHPTFLALWKDKARTEAREPWIADGSTISVRQSHSDRCKVAVTIDGSTAAYSLEEIERACSHRDPKVSAAWREIARRARVLL